MSLLHTLTRFSTASADGVPAGYTLHRRAASTYATNGVVVTGALTTLTIDAVVQPVIDGDGINVVPNGANVPSKILIHTSTPLTTTPNPDHITYRGEDYALIDIDGPYNISGVAFYRATAVRQVVP